MFVVQLRLVLALVAIGPIVGLAGTEEGCPKPVPPELVERLMVPAKVFADGATLRVDGTILEGAVAEVERLLIAAKASPMRSMVIRSPGGEAVAGLRLGELVRDWKLAVTVDGQCSSACANYAAIAARELVVPDDAVLGYHGGPWKTWGSDGRYLEALEKQQRESHECMIRGLNAKSLVDLDQLIADRLRRDKETYARQEALYRSLGVSTAIVEDSAPKKIAPATMVMFTRDVLERCYNLRNIVQYPTVAGDEIVRGKSTYKVIRDCPPRVP